MTDARSQLSRPPLLADRIAETLFREISQGKYKRGEKLPTERELAEAYGVSRPVVREALGHLRQDSVIVSRQGSGAYVADEPPSVFRLKPQGDTLDPTDLRHTVELLIAVEATASGYAAVRRTEAQLQAIRQADRDLRAAIDRGDGGVDEDIAFHRAIVVAADNPVFTTMLDFLDGRVRSFMRTARQNSARIEGLMVQVADEHALILAAIERGDKEGAHRAAAEHLNMAMRRLALYKPGWGTADGLLGA